MRAPIALAFAVAAAAPLTAAGFDNEPNGFRGIVWAAPIDSVKDELAELRANKATTFYTRKDDKLRIGEAALQSITYVFYKGRFTGAMVRTVEGVANQSALRSALIEQFGKGDQPNRYIERYYWWGATAIISLDCAAPNRACTAMLRSKALMDEENRDMKAAAKDAKKDF